MTQKTPVVINGRYELHRQIARGGMAEVFLSRDLLLNRPVAVKILFPEFAADEAFVERFRREAQSAASLTHPNIVAVYDWGAFEETYYIVMEYVEGRSLAEVLRSEGTLHPDRACDVATDIAGALFFAHRNGVVHRDIKPGNVIISPTGQLKVTDFGIARAMGSTSSDNLTQSGAVMGTATYFSPEQAQGQVVDPRSDLYSLGVVLYEMLAGSPPFRGETPVAIAYKHVKETAPSVGSINPAVPAELEAVTQKLLAKNPANRYPSAEDLRRDLRRYREGRPVEAEPIMAPPETGANGAAANPGAVAGGADEATRVAPAVTTGQADATQVFPATGRYDQPVAHGGYDEVRAYEAPRRTGVFLGVLVLMLCVLGGLLFLFANQLGIGNGVTTATADTAEVLDVVNETEAIGRAKLEGAGFLVDVEFEENDLAAAGTVVRQDPPAGSVRDKGERILLTVSSADSVVPVPGVVGMQEPDAARLLRDANFLVRIQRVSDDTKAENEVIEQSPAATTEAPEGSEVSLVVSLGSDKVSVPDVAGRTIEEAFSELSRQGFFPEAQTEKSSAQPIDRVVRTEPAANTPADPDSVVIVYLSDGAPIILVPEVRGLSSDVAQAQLTGLNLNVDINFIDLNQGDPRIGQVMNQRPGATTQLEELATVQIDVGRLQPGTAPATSPTETTAATTTTTAADPAPTTTAATPDPTTTTTTTTTTTAPPADDGGGDDGGGDADGG